GGRRVRMLCAAALIGLVSPGRCAAGAELVLEVVPLRHRTAEQVLPVIRPLVPPPGTASGFQDSLIVRTTPAALAEVRRVLDAIDRPPRRLRVTVRQDAGAHRAEAGAGIAGSADAAHGRVYATQSLDN